MSTLVPPLTPSLLSAQVPPMSTLVLPADMDVLGPAPAALSSSPLLGADFLSELQCAPWRAAPSCAPSAAAAAAVDALSDRMARLAHSTPHAAPRPILASRHRAADGMRSKKRVAFADDKGLALVQVRTWCIMRGRWWYTRALAGPGGGNGAYYPLQNV